MKYLPLVWSGLWRKPGRTILIFLQVSVAFALFGVLQGLKTGVAHAAAAARADLLIVHSRLSSIAQSLPLGLLGQIRTVPGVKIAIPVELSFGTWQDPSQGTGVVAVTPEDNWQEAFTYTIAPQYLEAFRKSRTAMLVRDLVAQKYGWKIGDRIPLKLIVTQQNGTNDWAFEVVGTFTDSDVGGGRYIVIVSYPYFDEARVLKKGTVNHFNVAISDPKLAAPVCDAIDRRFANSSHETKTESLREMAQANMQAIGDFDFLIRAVVGSVLVALLFATTTMMVQSIHERTPEFAVVIVAGLLLGMAVALVSATIPAMLAARLRVVTALAGHHAA